MWPWWPFCLRQPMFPHRYNDSFITNLLGSGWEVENFGLIISSELFILIFPICKCKLDHTWRPTEVCLLPVPLRREHELRGCRLWCCHLPLHFWLQPPPRWKHHRRMPRQNTGRTGSLKTKATSPETACAVRKYRFWMLLYQRQHKVPSNNQEPHNRYTIRPDRTQTKIFPQIQTVHLN